MRLLNAAAVLLGTAAVLLGDPIYNNVITPGGSYADASLDYTPTSLIASIQTFGGEGNRRDAPSASLSFAQQLTTAGPVRPGLIQVVLSAYGSNEGSYASGAVTLSGQPGAIDQYASTTCGATSGQACTIPPEHYTKGPLAFELGVPYTFAFSESGYAFTESDGEGTSAGYLMNYSYQLLEADGVTPVAVEALATPEPSSFGLFALALLLGINLSTNRIKGEVREATQGLRIRLGSVVSAFPSVKEEGRFAGGELSQSMSAESRLAFKKEQK